MEQQTQEVVEEAIEILQQEEPLTGDFIWAPSNREKIFVDIEGKSAYSQVLEFVSWTKPKEFSLISGKNSLGDYAVKLSYVR